MMEKQRPTVRELIACPILALARQLLILSMLVSHGRKISRPIEVTVTRKFASGWDHEATLKKGERP